MTEKNDQWGAEVHINEDWNTGEKIIIIRMIKNQAYESSYILDSLRVYENTISCTKWEAQEKEND